MRAVDEVLLELQARRIEVWAEGDSLRFKAPAGALDEALRADLTARKGEILAFHRRKALFERPIPRLPEGAASPLSSAQERMLFLEQLEERRAVYNMPAVFDCHGPLDEGVLRGSLAVLVRRHDSLRLSFPVVDGKPRGQLCDPYDPLRVTDLRGLPADEEQERVAALIRENGAHPFDLARGPLVTAHLVRLGDGERRLLLFNMHHIVGDGWSVGVLLREWQAVYDALAAGREPELPPLPIRYGDFAAWQRGWQEQGVLDGQLAYWRRRLDGAPELIELATDFPRPAVSGVAGRHLHRSLERGLCEDLRRLGRERGATPFMTLMGAFALLLARHGAGDELCIGTPVANRSHPDTEGLIGLFVNTLVLRTRIDPERDFRDLLAQVRHTALEAYAHQDIPFDYLVERLNPARSLSHTPLFQVMFSFESAEQDALVLGGTRLVLRRPDHDIAKFDLSLAVTERDGCFACDWEYRTDLFRPETVAALAERFAVLLAGIVRQPDRAIATLPLLTQADCRQLAEYNRTEMPLPADRTVVDLFEARVREAPAATALALGDRSLSYGELDRRANRVARRLIALGVGPDDLVGLSIERSFELIVGLLGILKAGGAYLPLDPEYPQQRLDDMLADSRLELVLTQSHLSARLPERVRSGLCPIDDPTLAQESEAAPARRSGPEHLAYVIYTSGSTGRPKGVTIPHAALHAYVQGAIGIYGMTPRDRVLQFASINFDVAAEEIWTTLAQGACLVLRESARLEDNRDFLAACEAQAISVLPLPTAYWNQLVDSQEPWPKTLRLAIIGGEAASASHIRRWLQDLKPAARLINSYGPTETTVGSTWYQVDQVPALGCPIGRPMPNERVYLLDRKRSPVPPGVPGELCIAGAGLARGYLNRPGLTDERFVEIEILGRRERVYRTGDLARWPPEGNLEYLGRIDDQVKLRGFRVEPGEIEAALTRHEGVCDAVVILHEQAGEPFLAAYVTAAPAAGENLPDRLRAFLRESLPQWMIPASFTVLDRLPLNPSGKVDRKALPAPERGSGQGTAGLIEPQSVLERKIAAVWREVLKLEQVGTRDNFFDLGGHSLLLLQVAARLREALGIALPVVDLFQYPTIGSLAAHLGIDKAARAAANEPQALPQSVTADEDIAIVGMAGRFPGAASVDAFWDNLRHGVESIRFFSDEELLESGVAPELFDRPDYVRAAGVLDEPEYFDAAFFGYPPKEAELLDPQQRLFMETAWTAIEHAGYDVGRIPFPVGVFAGAGASTYFLNNLWSNPALLAQFGRQLVSMSSDKDFLATRTAYKLDLRGPALSINTACSTSLVAVHLARQSLLRNECRMALAGGASVFFPQKQGYVYQEGMIMSPDGHCRAFDADARGTVSGAGVAAVVLKRLAHALEDGDTIHAVIKGSAVNNDGCAKVGFTAPSVDGQARVIGDAMRGLDYESIGYLEAHGTGTPLGDPIEIAALSQAYRSATNKTGYCALGSVKTNVGHLDTAAGVAGLIKAVLALKHREIPPSLHFKAPNPQIDFAGSPFVVTTALQPWESSGPRRAGVSSFGVGGTNAHVVLEEAPAPISGDSRPWQLLCLSAKTHSALRRYRDDLGRYLACGAGESKLADIAYTCNVGRATFAHRGFLIARDPADAIEQLSRDDSGRWQGGRQDGTPAAVVLMFPGQGSQYARMTAELYSNEPKYRAEVDACAQRLRPRLQLDIRDVLFAADGQYDIQRTELTQPALFTVEYALARLWMYWGIQPSALLGHSVGEYVAACLAGVFSLDEALGLVAARGRLIQSLPGGDMLAVPLAEQEARDWCSATVSLAAVNHPRQCVLAGTPEALAQLRAELERQGIDSRPLRTSHAFHSHLLEPVLASFARHLEQVDLQAPRIPYLSNLTGDWIRAHEATDPDYWVRHLRHSVRFADNLERLFAKGVDLLLEVGPGRTLSTLARQHPAFPKGCVSLQTLPADRATAAAAEIRPLLATLGQLWQHGASVDWTAFYAHERRLRVPLPTYPFERRRYWIEPAVADRRAPVCGDTPTTVASADGAVADNDPGDTDRDAAPGQVSCDAPRTATERKLAAIWQSLLGVESIARGDEFFALGGNSLLGAQVLSRLRESFAGEIPLHVLFEYPVLADLADWLDRGQGQAPAILPPILPQAPDAPLAMSFSQQRLRFLAQLEGDSATYNLPGVVHLAGRLSESALRRAFAALIERHDSLRLSFPVVDGEARVHKGGVYDPLEIEDLSDLPAAEQEPAVRAWMTRHAQAPFDLDQGPLLRLNLLRLGAEAQLVLVNMHHIVSDGWTIGLLMHEWSLLYNAYLRGEPPDLPALPIRYTDYAAWQREWLQGAVLERQLGYWREKLAGAPQLITLPTDFPRPAVTSYRGRHLRLGVDPELTQRIERFGQEQGATLFMTLLAAFKVLLFRYSGQRDLSVGTPVAGRTRRETEGLVGFFVNTLVLRDRLAPQDGFAALLQQVKRTALEAQDHQDIPFEHLVEQLNPSRSLSHAPLFQVMFALQNAPEHRLQLDGLQARPMESDIVGSKFDLTLSVEARDRGLACDWEYASDLFRPETVARMHAHWLVLLRGILADPSQPIGRLPMLTEADVRQLAAWSRTADNTPEERAPIDLFEAWAAETPDAIAVLCGDEQLTYGQLDTQANRLAHALIEAGVGADTVVGICAERTPAAIVGVLGILKAGGAYLPLDPAYPQDRLRFMLGDSGAPVLLVQGHLSDRFGTFGGSVLDLDNASRFADRPAPGPTRNGTPGDLAYVIYTSGSTGRPKGVTVEGRSLTTLLQGFEQIAPTRRPLRGAALCPFSFDVSVWEIFAHLCFGGSLRLIDLQAHLDPAELADTLSAQGIDSLYLPPNLLEPLIDELERRTGALGWQRLLVGVEPIAQGLMQRYRRLAPGLSILNGYGPTETTVCATLHVFTQAQQPERRMPIGKPLPGYEIHLLDADGQPVPPGVPGELCVAGRALARGYLNRPELTDERFVEIEVFGERARRYRTGDLARWLPGGHLEYLGRMDRQVKLRGFRIELGEIEAALARHPGVKEAVVVLRDNAGSPFLAAYVTEGDRRETAASGQGEGNGLLEALRTSLKDSLPDYMIPASFTLLDALPLTRNGKIDRKALPEPAAPRSAAQVAPHGETERLLAGLWSAVLKTEVTSVAADFFEQGGHSLLAAQLVARIRDAFGVEMPLRALFEHPVLADLAAWLDRQRRGEVLPPILPQPASAPLALSASQERLRFLAELEGPSATYNIPGSVRLRGRLDVDALRRGFVLLVERHQSLRMRFPALDGQSVVELLPVYDPLQVNDLSDLDADRQAEAVERLTRRHGAEPFDLSAGPLLRIELLVLGAEEQVLLFNMHHVISDGWSMAILLREAAELYTALAQGQTPELKPLPIRYTDYAAWQRQVLAGETLVRQIDWWQETLAGAPPLLELPTDRPRPAVQSFRGASLTRRIGPELTRGLRELSRQQGSTLFMTLLAAFDVLLARHSGQADIVVGTPAANRSHSQTEDLIGFFVNTLVLRTRLDPEQPFTDLLRRTRQTCLGAYAHQDIPFEMLVEQLKPTRSLDHSPLFQVMLALQSNTGPGLQLPNLTVSPLAADYPTAKFDLTLDIEETADQLICRWEYAADLFLPATVERMAGHFEVLLAGIVADPQQAVGRLPLLTEAELRQLAEWNDTETAFPDNQTLVSLFETSVEKTPDAVAVVFEGERLTYRQLNERSNRLAHLLRELSAADPSPPAGDNLIAICLERSIDMVVGLLAILKAGGAYVPMAADWPLERMKYILSTQKIRRVVTQIELLSGLQTLQWELPGLNDLVCLDVDSPEVPPEPLDTGTLRALFDSIAERAVDEIGAAGFVSSYTGEAFSQAQVDEYAQGVLRHLQPHLAPGARVLEIGCGSGLLMFAIAPQVGRYLGVDPSGLTQERNREQAAARGLHHIELVTAFAHELDQVDQGPFDLVLLASTVQFFPGYRYLQATLEAALDKLAPGGVLLVADVMDPRQKADFRRSLEEHKQSQPADRQSRTKTRLDSELYVDERFFAALRWLLDGVAEVSVSKRDSGYTSELRYRYDVLIRKTGRRDAPAAQPVEPSKRVWTHWHVARCPAHDPAPVLTPDDLAYIIYTSGSTGTPKGVELRHRPVVNLIDWVNKTFHVGPGERLLFVTSYCFDLSVYDVFGILAAGGSVHVASQAALREPQRLLKQLRDERITFWDSAPAALAQLVAYQGSAPIPSEHLRLVFLSGDWIPVSLPERLRAIYPNAKVIGLGGATEAAIWSNWYPIGEVDPGWKSIPYGKPIQNAKYYVLDGQLNQCPLGVPGSLYIGGDCLASGYANDPSLSAQRFIPSPFSDDPEARIYHTGDLARWMPDGNMELLGRIDTQVKLRGFRIELGEIESVLNRHRAVKEAIVSVYDREGDKSLVAYLIPAAPAVDRGALPGELQGHLRAHLPDYMIPAHFIVLDRIPLTSNGKVDRKALPEPQAPESVGGQPPATPTEELLAGLWAAVLKQERIRRDDNFFELGGHSLLASQLVSRVRDSFKVELPVRSVFESPRLAQLAAAIDAAGRARDLPGIAAQAASAPKVLSFSQQRLWFLAHMEGQNAAYNMPIVLKLHGPLDEDALRSASQALIRRHECLRLCFPEVDGIGTVEPIPVYDPLTVVDLSGLPEAERERQRSERLARHGKDAFDLTRGPLLRLDLLKLDERERLLLLNMHHIVSDGWSMGVLVRDWSELYRAAVDAREPRLPALSIQYTDYAAWQRDWLQGDALKAQLGYWRDKLAGAPELLDLPTDFPRPAVKTYRGRHLESTLPADLAEAVKRLSREQGATVFMTLLAAFDVLLYRYSGQGDLMVGTPIANRTQRQSEDLIGFFVNTLVLRSRLDDGQGFADLLRQVRETALEAYGHQDIPFEYLVEQLNPARSTSFSPLFQVMFILQNTPMEALEFGGGIDVEVLEPELTTAKLDLTLSITERDGGFVCDWEYSTDLFEAETVARMAGHFETLLRELSRAPQRPISSFSLLTAAEEQAIAAWNARVFDYPATKTLVDLFEERAAMQPDAIAARFADRTLSYGELNGRANRLAAHLRGLGVGPDVLVGLFVERSLDMPVGLLGILKAGGAYVPMDPEYPKERLQAMLEDAEVRVLLTQQGLLEYLPACDAVQVCLDRDRAAIEAHSPSDPPRASGPADLAYVIFTSGSTGRPKGVMIEHGALLNFLTYMGQRIGIRESDRVLALTTLSFDIAGLELYLPLVAGSQVVIVPRETAMSGDLLMQTMDEQGITIMQATPATWKLLLASGWQQRTPLTVLCGGEAMPGELGRKLLENSTQLWNVYGPTETTIWSSMHDCTAHPERPELIGTPIGNTAIYILDPQGIPVPPGMPGELCIGGLGLARGYLSRPELTAERFVQVDLLGERRTLYKTGDLARMLRNGQLECLGRIDRQVKLRGFRIELGEIEEALNRHPKVREAAVVADPARESLLAYVVPRSSAEDTDPDEQVRHWEQVWSDAYRQTPDEMGDDIEDRRRNTAGWNSSYTLEPIPDAEMKEWLDCTVEQVLALKPRRILEIGCGTGMLLFRLAPHCEHYTGADISPQALGWVERQMQGWEFADRVTLIESAADRIADPNRGIAPGSVDLVILNSVIQYFPSLDYLTGVLRTAVALTAPGGQVFVGDVRNHQLLEAFHASIQLFQADDGLPVAELRRRVSASLQRERELSIDPDWFRALRRELPAIGEVRIALRNGAAHNEMTRFRYDATLGIGAVPEQAPAQPREGVRQLDWQQDDLSLERLRELLAEDPTEILEIRGIPNARLATERPLLEQLGRFEGSVADLKAALAGTAAAPVDPEHLRALVHGGPFVCTLYYYDRFRYTAVLEPARSAARPYLPAARPVSPARPWSSFANTPALEILDQAAFVTELRDRLTQRLPAYMVPGSFTVLERLPLTPNGKIDRKALPEPQAQRRDHAYRPPRDTLELQLVQIWEDLLKLRPVGIRDNFFEQGGHSLLAVRLMARIEQQWGKRLALTTLFHNASIEALAQVLRRQGEHRPWSCLVPIQPAGRDTPLFCVHPAGGNVLCYLDLARQLGPDQPLYAFQARGLEAGQTPEGDVTAMARTYLAAMKTVQPQGPYRLLGWSFGGLVAVEMAAQLEARGDSASFLGLLDTVAPEVIREILDEPEDDAQFFADYFAEADAELSLDHLRTLDPEAQLAYVIEQGRQAGIFPSDVDEAQTRRLIRVYRSSMAAAPRYRPGQIECGITLFQAQERRPEHPTLPKEHGWQTHTGQGVESIAVPGRHHTMLSSPHVEVLAQRLRACLGLDAFGAPMSPEGVQAVACGDAIASAAGERVRNDYREEPERSSRRGGDKRPQ